MVANSYLNLRLYSFTQLYHNNMSLVFRIFGAEPSSVFPEDGSGLKIRKNKDLYYCGEVECMKIGEVKILSSMQRKNPCFCHGHNFGSLPLFPSLLLHHTSLNSTNKFPRMLSHTHARANAHLCAKMYIRPHTAMKRNISILVMVLKSFQCLH